MKIMKFGGSSLADADCLRRVAQQILAAAAEESVVVVVSACLGITNQLLACAGFAALGKKKFRQQLASIIVFHQALKQALWGESAIPTALETTCLALEQELTSLLEGVWLLREAAPSVLDHVASLGERFSSVLLAAFLHQHHPAVAVDTRSFIVTNDHFTAAGVKFTETNRYLRRWYARALQAEPAVIPIMTGFIASTKDGRTTTLGRNGSDYSAAIIGAALSARIVEIWTDVDGVYSADPNIVADAFVIPELSYEEAMELSHFGAKVLHPATLAPIREQMIPLHVRNTFSPAHPGTKVLAKKTLNIDSVLSSPATGITAIDGITLLSWAGRRRANISTTVEQLFHALASADINIFFVSQASSQHTLTLAILSKDAEKARTVLRTTFQLALRQRQIRLEEKSGQMIIAIVGDQMKGVPGIAGKMFHSLGQQGISIRAIAQGASEHNISLVIDAAQQGRALNLVHDAFFSKEKKLGLVLVGVGNVGKTVLTLLAQQLKQCRLRGFHVRLCAIANSRHMCVVPEGIAPENAMALLDASREAYTLDGLLAALKYCEFLPLAFVDCTASTELVYRYADLVRAGLHIVTPNKKANVLPYSIWQELIATFRLYERHFLYQTNVGAGLPVLSTLRDLLAGGDAVIKIEGILSGTLGYLFNHYDGTQPFAEVLQQAQMAGLTEPDPREDLSGNDVARKLVIMAREIGLPMELEDVMVENLVPEELQRGAFSANFYKKFIAYEKKFQSKLHASQKQEGVLRYVGTLSAGKAHAGLQSVPKDHPLALTRASDNVIVMTTERYQVTPLVIQGLGAGAEVTAMGVFSDILRLLHYLPY